MMHTQATVIKSNTFVGDGSTPSILIVQPTFEKQYVRHVHENEYAQEAAEVLMFLQGTFSNKTLAALAERLSVFKKGE
jgi:hypothetical protein